MNHFLQQIPLQTFENWSNIGTLIHRMNLLSELNQMDYLVKNKNMNMAHRI